jgi:hypothetical protein
MRWPDPRGERTAGRERFRLFAVQLVAIGFQLVDDAAVVLVDDRLLERQETPFDLRAEKRSRTDRPSSVLGAGATVSVSRRATTSCGNAKNVAIGRSRIFAMPFSTRHATVIP